jgi:hypothetical protein
MKPQFFSTRIPFSGFYWSIHSNAIDNTEEQMFTSSSGELYNELHEDFFLHVNWPEVYEEYTKTYTEEYAKELGITLQYEEKTSPREYNFETDRIFAKISRNDLAKILNKVRGKKLNETINNLFTSRSGFISYYTNNIKDWGRISTWDHNQIYAVLVACGISEETIMSNIFESENVEDWIYNAADREGKLSVKFADIVGRVYG